MPNVTEIINIDSLRRKVAHFGLEFRHYNVADIISLGHFKSTVVASTVDDLYTWCQDNFGDDWIWSVNPGSGEITIFFRKQSDQLLFNLRWSAQLVV